MAYRELIKNFEHIRAYLRDFYVYGFKSREEYDRKSLRSYDNERRRIESWLDSCVSFRHSLDGKNVFLSIDSRHVRRNPLYKAWKTCSFTDRDITLHFILFDLFASPQTAFSLSEITERIDRDYLADFAEPLLLDESTVRKKLKEYTEEGLLLTERHGKKLLYRRAAEFSLYGYEDALAFFSETAPCGVIGSFLLDKLPMPCRNFAFKHHYITHTLDSEILCTLFLAMSEKRRVTIEKTGRREKRPAVILLVPLAVYISVQNGRQYLMGYRPDQMNIASYRLDYIQKVTPQSPEPRFDEYRERLRQARSHMWGVICPRNPRQTEHVEFTVRVESGEEYIVRRLEREKRCGTVERLDEHTCHFQADVYDISEMIPWIRTFICRITSLSFSNKTLEKRFRADLNAMYRQYGIEEGGNADALQ